MNATADVNRTPGLRVFFALWPPESLQDELSDAATALASRCGGRAIARRNIHLTLFFVGRIDRAQLEPLLQAASRIQSEAFELELARIRYWRHNRILWAGVQMVPPALLVLEADLRRELATCGIEGEERPYVPHVTLVREAQGKPLETGLSLQRWPVRSFALVQSISAAGGVRYEPLTHWPFSSGGSVP